MDLEDQEDQLACYQEQIQELMDSFKATMKERQAKKQQQQDQVQPGPKMQQCPQEHRELPLEDQQQEQEQEQQQRGQQEQQDQQKEEEQQQQRGHQVGKLLRHKVNRSSNGEEGAGMQQQQQPHQQQQQQGVGGCAGNEDSVHQIGGQQQPQPQQQQQEVVVAADQPLPSAPAATIEVLSEDMEHLEGEEGEKVGGQQRGVAAGAGAVALPKAAAAAAASLLVERQVGVDVVLDGVGWAPDATATAAACEGGALGAADGGPENGSLRAAPAGEPRDSGDGQHEELEGFDDDEDELLQHLLEASWEQEGEEGEEQGTAAEHRQQQKQQGDGSSMMDIAGLQGGGRRAARGRLLDVASVQLQRARSRAGRRTQKQQQQRGGSTARPLMHQRQQQLRQQQQLQEWRQEGGPRGGREGCGGMQTEAELGPRQEHKLQQQLQGQQQQHVQGWAVQGAIPESADGNVRKTSQPLQTDGSCQQQKPLEEAGLQQQQQQQELQLQFLQNLEQQKRKVMEEYVPLQKKRQELLLLRKSTRTEQELREVEQRIFDIESRHSAIFYYAPAAEEPADQGQQQQEGEVHNSAEGIGSMEDMGPREGRYWEEEVLHRRVSEHEQQQEHEGREHSRQPFSSKARKPENRERGRSHSPAWRSGRGRSRGQLQKRSPIRYRPGDPRNAFESQGESRGQALPPKHARVVNLEMGWRPGNEGPMRQGQQRVRHDKGQRGEQGVIMGRRHSGERQHQWQRSPQQQQQRGSRGKRRRVGVDQPGGLSLGQAEGCMVSESLLLQHQQDGMAYEQQQVGPYVLSLFQQEQGQQLLQQELRCAGNAGHGEGEGKEEGELQEQEEEWDEYWGPALQEARREQQQQTQQQQQQQQQKERGQEERGQFMEGELGQQLQPADEQWLLEVWQGPNALPAQQHQQQLVIRVEQSQGVAAISLPSPVTPCTGLTPRLEAA